MVYKFLKKVCDDVIGYFSDNENYFQIEGNQKKRIYFLDRKRTKN